MTYDELWLYVNNQYVNAVQNGMLGTDIVIPKEDYFLFWKFVMSKICVVRLLSLALMPFSMIILKMKKSQKFIILGLKDLMQLTMNICV